MFGFFKSAEEKKKDELRKLSTNDLREQLEMLEDVRPPIGLEVKTEMMLIRSILVERRLEANRQALANIPKNEEPTANGPVVKSLPPPAPTGGVSASGQGYGYLGSPGGYKPGPQPPTGSPQAQTGVPNAPSEKRSGGFFFSEPDAPLRPHKFYPQAELISNPKSPRVLITPKAYKQMLLYVDIASKEVGWLGTVTQLESGDFLIDETFLLEQEVTAVETELSVAGQDKLSNDLLNKGDEGFEQLNRLRFWGHSHVRMGTSPSGTDESTMRRFGRDGMPWYIRGIFNKLGRGSFSIYFYERGYRINDAPWAVYDPESQRIVLDGAGSNYTSHYWHQEKAPAATGADGENKPVATAVLKAKPLPNLLVPSAEMRAEVTAEFQAKVTEATPTVVRWLWGGSSNSSNTGSQNSGNGSYNSSQAPSGNAIVPGGDAPSERREGLEEGDNNPADGQEVDTVDTRGPDKPSTKKQEPGIIETFFKDFFDGLFLGPDQKK